jgi:hypothetical protein
MARTLPQKCVSIIMCTKVCKARQDSCLGGDVLALHTAGLLVVALGSEIGGTLVKPKGLK